MKITHFPAEAIDEAVAMLIDESDVVVDVGPGIRPQKFIEPRVHLCLEPFKAYVDKVAAGERGGLYTYVNSTWDLVLPLMADKSVDTLFALDVIEHMSTEEGKKLLAEAERVCKKQIIIFTPLGFYPQSYEEGEEDRWGMAGGHWQTHRSGWTPEDFGPQWEFLVCEDYHKDENLTEPMGAFWAIRNLAEREGLRGGFRLLLKRSSALVRDYKRFIKRSLVASTPKFVSNALRTLFWQFRQCLTWMLKS